MGVQHRIKRGLKPPKKGETFLDPGESWYKLTPSKIEVINYPLFGWDKKEVQL